MNIYLMDKKIKKILQCPNCSSEKFIDKVNSYECKVCKSSYKYDKGQLDLRLPKEKVVNIPFAIGGDFVINHSFAPLSINENSQLNFNSLKVPAHLTKELLSHFPKGDGGNSLALDLGSGKVGVHKEVVETAGYIYVGFDYESPSADIIGDAHSLPFLDNSFDFVLSMAVLEHIKFPFIYSKEIYRVLKPNGTLIGSVAFLEGFHSHSYYHHTHYGTYNTLDSAGFNNITVAPNARWHVLKAQSSFLFPKLPRRLSRLIIFPVYLFSRIWFVFLSLIKRKNMEGKRILSQSASFFFIARK